MNNIAKIIPAEPTKQKHNHKMAPPVYLAKLADLVGSAAEAGRRLGISGGTVSKAIGAGEAKMVNEVAAKGVYDQLMRLTLLEEASAEELIIEARDLIERAQVKGAHSIAVDSNGNLTAGVTETQTKWI